MPYPDPYPGQIGADEKPAAQGFLSLIGIPPLPPKVPYKYLISLKFYLHNSSYAQSTYNNKQSRTDWVSAGRIVRTSIGRIVQVDGLGSYDSNGGSTREASGRHTPSRTKPSGQTLRQRRIRFSRTSWQNKKPPALQVDAGGNLTRTRDGANAEQCSRHGISMSRRSPPERHSRQTASVLARLGPSLFAAKKGTARRPRSPLSASVACKKSDLLSEITSDRT